MTDSLITGRVDWLGVNGRIQFSGGVPVPVNPIFKVPAYQHSFGLTANYMVISEHPCMFGTGGFDTFKFYAGVPVTRRVVSLQTGLQVMTFESPTFFMMHHVNAWEDPTANTITVDLITYPDGELLDAFYLNVMKTDFSKMVQTASKARLMRYVLPLSQPSGTQVQGTVMSTVV